MDDDQQFCLRWNNHQSTLISVFDTLLENGTLVDCTLAAEGKFLKAHKVVLSACSPYFAALLSQQYDKHPIFILKDVKFQELRAMMDYMYRGEVNISQDQLAALLKAAESLQIKGLSDNRGSSSNAPSQLKQQQQQQQQSETSTTKTLQPPVPANKAPGLTIENKKPLKAELGDSDRSGSREGSTSPTLRKRKKIRRRSVDTNNLIDNHDQHSNSSSHSMHTLQPQALALTSSSIVASVPAANCATSLSSSTTSPSNSTNVLVMSAAAAAAAAAAAIKKTEPVQQQQVAEASKLQLVKHQSQQQSQQQQAQHTDDEERSGTDQGDAICDRDSDNDIDEPQSKRQAQGSVSIDSQDDKSLNQSELMIEPKNEYDDGQDENVEDLTLDEEELLDDLDQAGPSHGGEGSSQGYAQWQMEREQSEAFMAAQDAVGGQHREAQDDSSSLGGGYTKIKLENFNLWTDSDFIAIADQSVNSSGGSPRSPSNYIPVWRCKTAKAATRVSLGRVKMASKKTSSLCSTIVTSPGKASQKVTGSGGGGTNSSSSTVGGNTSAGNGISGFVRKEDKIVFQHENDTKPWKCKTCGRNYKWKNSLKCHIKNECGVPPKYFCERMCGYKTHIHSNLKRHLNSKFCKPN